MHYVVSFRITNPPNRRKVKRLLEGYGWLVMPNLYECPLIPSQARDLVNQLEPLLSEDDQVRIYKVCKGCLKTSWRWRGPEWSKRPSGWIF